MALNLRTDAEYIRETRGTYGKMLSARIPAASQSLFATDGGVANGTFITVGALETGEREIRVAALPTVAKLPCMVIRGEVNASQYVLTDDLWGKFRMDATKPLPCVQLTVGDFVGLSQDYFASADIAGLAVGQKFCLDATKFVAGTQLVKTASPTAGNVVFEIVEIKDNMIPTYLLGAGSLPTTYKMVSLEVKIA